MATITTKTFESDLFVPKATPDGTSLQEQLNVFTATLDEKDILDVIVHAFSSAKYGLSKTYTAVVIYKV